MGVWGIGRNVEMERRSKISTIMLSEENLVFLSKEMNEQKVKNKID